jgi:hypothetical protein
MWPAQWKDYRVVASSGHGSRGRVDLLGVAGIGKTTFTRQLAFALGERTPRCRGKKPVPEDWAIAFEEIYNDHFQFSASVDDSWTNKHRRTVHLTEVIDLEKNILQCDSNRIVLNGVSLLRHRLSYFVEQAEARPDFVARLLSDRVIVLCTAKDPVSRSIRGKITRGDRDSRARGLELRVADKVEKIEVAVRALKSLSVPVLELDLDQPRPQAIAQVARFMHDNGMESTYLTRQASRL